MQENAKHPSSLLLAVLASLILTTSLTAAGRSRDGSGTRGPTEVIDGFFDAYRAGDVESMLSIYAEDAKFTDVNQRHELTGHTALHGMLGQLTAIHKEMDVTVKRQAATGELVTVEVVYTGTLDSSAIGRPDGPDLEYSLPAVLLFEVEGDHIQSQTDYLDFRTFTESLGFLMSPAAE